MILLEEAVARFNTAGRPYGVEAKRWRRSSRVRSLLDDLSATVSPLQMPAELRTFLATYDPSTIEAPALDGFIPLDRLAFRREIDCPPAPLVLFPIADWTHSRVWVELASRNHPGGRIFQSYHDESEVSLWAFGLSELFDLLSAAFERDLIDDRRGTLDANHLDTLISRRLDAVLPPSAPRRFEAVDRSQFLPHWQHGEGLTIDYYTLRGATHSVASLQAARIDGGHLNATMVGKFVPGIGGGPIQGSIGRLIDDTGSLQIFVPHPTAVNGAVGPEGRVEIDVVAVPASGVEIEALASSNDLADAIASGWGEESAGLIDRLLAELPSLDTSVVVTAMRPIR